MEKEVKYLNSHDGQPESKVIQAVVMDTMPPRTHSNDLLPTAKSSIPKFPESPRTVPPREILVINFLVVCGQVSDKKQGAS